MVGDQTEFLLRLLDALPTVVFVVDADVRILYANSTALDWLRANQGAVFMARAGEALHCLHADERPGGCGHAEACRGCVIRASVQEALRGGRVHRRQTRLAFRREETASDAQLLITAARLQSPGRDLVLLILEDISELIQLRRFLPICASCKRIRNDADYWESVEAYFERQLGVDFTHSICPECMQHLYPEVHRPSPLPPP